MATVSEIVDRLAREDPLYGIYRPGLGVSKTQAMKLYEKEVEMKPTRKITVAGLAAAAATVVAFMVSRYVGTDLDETAVAGLTGLITVGLGYLVPDKKT